MVARCFCNLEVVRSTFYVSSKRLMLRLSKERGFDFDYWGGVLTLTILVDQDENDVQIAKYENEMLLGELLVRELT